MKLIKLGSVGPEVVKLCELLGVEATLEFTKDLRDKVVKFQESHSETPDGIVGNGTWIKLLIDSRKKTTGSSDIVDLDYTWAAEYLECDPASIKAIREVETGGRNGFVSPGHPQILFEGHLFWKELEESGTNPESIRSQFPSIIYPKWTKQYYLGGIREYERFDRACTISRTAAIRSTSFGLFQILGSNYKACGCKTVEEFYDLMCKSQFEQFVLGISFIARSGMSKYLREHDWVGFAEKYNGPLQAQNQYSEKLSKAWEKYNK